MESNTIIMLLIVAAAVVVAFVALRGKGAAAEEDAPAADEATPAAPAPVPAAPAAPRAPQVEAGIPPEVVAAIAAAIHAMGGGRYTLRAVRYADRTSWARAGAADTTAPF